ncbi:hypothetical protein [Parapedobacter defluvii]|uniref:hypothetical protein n=1 Tax=Parapedobacter defluvii TaxID=2045106 RepID=UPI00166CCB8D|nr:hypothetical protein [Parapedobacter defluvii]
MLLQKPRLAYRDYSGFLRCKKSDEALAQNENDQGVSKIVITQTGSSYACIDGVGYKVVSYNRACEGEGDFECTPGNYSVYTPSSQGCGGA